MGDARAIQPARRAVGYKTNPAAHCGLFSRLTLARLVCLLLSFFRIGRRARGLVSLHSHGMVSDVW
jgi:hypothetical protein